MPQRNAFLTMIVTMRYRRIQLPTCFRYLSTQIHGVEAVRKPGGLSLNPNVSRTNSKPQSWSEFSVSIDKWLPNCTTEQISDFMRKNAKKFNNPSFLHTKRYLPNIAVRLKSMSSLEWRFKEFAFVHNFNYVKDCS
jgi:hypothetical protein